MEKKVYEFISKQTNDPIIEWKTCKISGSEFPFFASELKLLENISPVIDGKKYILSSPEISPDMRNMQRLAIRNERKFYTFTNALGKKEITTISPDMNKKIVSMKEYFDQDNTALGISYSGDFLSDLKNLIFSLPQPSKLTYEMENADYCNQESDDKNCYMNAWWHVNENSAYTTYSVRSKWTIDNYRVWDCENIYQSLNVSKSQNVFFSQYIENVFNVWFAYDIIWGQNILFGSGLRNASYVYKNKVLQKEEWEKIFHEYKEKIKSYAWLQEVMKEYEIFLQQFPKKAILNTNVENVSGNELTNSKNVVCGFVGEESYDVANSYIFAGIKTCADLTSTWWCEKSYNIGSSMQLMWWIVCSHIMAGDTHDTMYGYMMQSGGNNLWSCWLSNQEYTILNKKYEPNLRKETASNIIEELQAKNMFWEFFDVSLSPYPYNDSVAYDYYPVGKVIENGSEKIVDKHGIGVLEILNPDQTISDAIWDLWGEKKLQIRRRTKENEINIPQGISVINTYDIPDNIDDVKDDIIEKAILCETSWRPFRLISMELTFYRKHGLPIPRKHYDVRHYEKLQKRLWIELYLRTCDKCWVEMLSVYDEKYTGKVYCEACYDKEIYE